MNTKSNNCCDLAPRKHSAKIWESHLEAPQKCDFRGLPPSDPKATPKSGVVLPRPFVAKTPFGKVRQITRNYPTLNSAEKAPDFREI